jgi:hypothetical protein
VGSKAFYYIGRGKKNLVKSDHYNRLAPGPGFADKLQAWAAQCRKKSGRVLFGERLWAFNPFIETEAVVSFDDTYWSIRIGEEIHSVASISVEIGACHVDRAVILASGPSLMETLSFEENAADTYFALNGAARFLDRFADSKRYLTVCDRIFSRHNSSVILASLEQGAILLTTPECLLILIRCCPQIVPYFPSIRLFQVVGDPYGCELKNEVELNRLGLFPQYSDGRSLRVGWSSRVDYGVFSGATVAFPALQIALGMSAGVVEFHGLDLNDKGRAYHEDEAEPSKLGRHYATFIKPSFELAARHLKNTGVKVRNHSPDCPIRFEELFNQ